MHTSRTGIITRVAIITDIGSIRMVTELAISAALAALNQGSHRVLGKVKVVSALFSPGAI
jgi:hypothetical protein